MLVMYSVRKDKVRYCERYKSFKVYTFEKKKVDIYEKLTKFNFGQNKKHIPWKNQVLMIFYQKAWWQ